MKTQVLLLLLFLFLNFTTYGRQPQKVMMIAFDPAPCDEPIDYYQFKNKIIGYWFENDTFKVQVAVKANCCADFTASFEFEKKILDLQFYEYDGNCECFCCYQFIYSFTGFKEKDFRIKINGENAWLPNSLFNFMDHSYESLVTFPLENEVRFAYNRMQLAYQAIKFAYSSSIKPFVDWIENYKEQTTMNQPNFPKVEPIKVVREDDFYAQIQIGGRFIDFEINFEEEENLNKNEILQLQKKILYNLPTILTEIHQAIADSYKNGGEAKEYIEMHLEVLEEDDLLLLLKDTDTQKNKMDRLYAVLHLHNIWAELEEESNLGVVFDFTIGKEFVDYVIAVAVNADGKITAIDLES